MEALSHNKDEIIRELRKDPLVIKSDNQKINSGELKLDSSELLRQEATLANELNTLDNLKALSTLIVEVKTNLDLLELENCFYSLQSLRTKMRKNTAFLKQSFNFQQSVSSYVDTLHLELVNALHKILTTGFWKITENSIQFTPTVKWGKNEVDIEYDTFMDFVVRQYFPQSSLDNQAWIISDMGNADSQEQVRAKLNTILKDYINLTSVVNMIKCSIFIPGRQVSYEEEKNMLVFSQSSLQNNTSAALTSFETVCDFVLDRLSLRDKKTLSYELGHLFNTEFTKFVKNNASIILDSLDSPLKKLVSVTNDKLIRLASETGVTNWSYSGKEIQDLLMNKQLYYNLLLDKILESHIKDLRNIFDDPDKSWKILKTVEIRHVSGTTNTISENKRKNHTDIKQEKKEQQHTTPKDDDWNWEMDDDADAWGDEIDVDIDDEEEKPTQEVAKEPEEPEEEESAWGEAWEISEDESLDDASLAQGKKLPKVHNLALLNKDRIEVTQLPEIFLTVSQNFKDFFADSHVDEQYFAYKYNLLQTSYVAMCTISLSHNWCQLYVDMRYLIEQGDKLYRIKELTRNLLETRLNMKYRFVSKQIGRQLTNFRENEKAPSWDATIEKLLPYILKEIIYPLEKIRGEEGTRYLLSFLNFLYNDCVTNEILKWQIISEVNSENLSELVSLLVGNTEVQLLANEPSYQKMREKFATTGKFLPLHLKEIMEMFYNGDFYLFATDELIQWIELLFADTPLRRNAIDDIHEIRGTTLDD
ncbi:dsl1p [Saccharomyces arboricola H-6]|uniref:Dsl1p n=1 Tax=Saccharomyces arboricola (strain H-6 / AS 2.3317 / CBS 10644) TaxID=1160507 RepID=J8Q396_SACAR|nr:dsl1p [Saccharomyces arboricola H-6]